MADSPATRPSRLLYIGVDDVAAEEFEDLLHAAAPDAFSITRRRTVATPLVEVGTPQCAVLAVDVLDDAAVSAIACLSALAPSGPIIVVSNERDESCALAIEAGATDGLSRGSFGGQTLVRTIRNAIARKRLETSLAEAQAVARIGSWELDLTTSAVTCSHELCRIFDLRPTRRPSMEEIVALIHPDDREASVRAIGEAIENVRPFVAKHRLLLFDGSVRWIHSKGRVEAGADGRATTIFGTSQDVTDQKLAEQLVRDRAFRDSLTGLPNRLALMHRLSNALDRLEGSSVVGVIYLDIDGFQTFNDSLGHAVGDELLVAVAERLGGSARPGDLLSHVDGDEFVMLCERLSDEQEVVAVADSLRAAMAQPISWRGGEVTLGISAGVAVSSVAAVDPEFLLRDAIAAMYRAKTDGRGRTSLFEPSVWATTVERLEMLAALRQSIADGDLRVHYQPIVSLTDNRTVGHEALVRWEHPQRGLLSPDHFIALAEESGLIVPLGGWVLREACRQAVTFQQLDPVWNHLTMSVNLSGSQLVQLDLVAMVEDALEASHLAPSHLQLEMTESVLMDDAVSASAVLRDLKAVGVRLAIDDFGTGFSSLAYLKRFPVDVIKIDRSFVSGLGEDLEDSAIVAAVMSLADALGMTVVAEGVETALQRDCLVDVGCQSAQGYLFSKPVVSAVAQSALVAARAADDAVLKVVPSGSRSARADPATLQQELREAISGDELRCLLQPVVSLTSGAVEGLDAMLRWAHPRRGLLDAKEFVPAELVPALDCWLLDAALRMIAAPGPAHGLTVSVTTSVYDIGDPDFAERTLRSLRHLDLAPTTLALAVSGSAALAADDAVGANIRALRRMGVGIYVDDVGIWDSPFGSLHRLQVDAIKIDRSFVDTLAFDRRAEGTAALMTATARALNLVTIAVGVDTAEQARALTRLGVDRGQGRHFLEPSTISDLEAWMSLRFSGGEAALGATTLVRRRARTTSTTRSAIDPDAANARLLAGRALLRIEAVEEAVGVCTALIRELGGSVIPARLDNGSALALDCSFGHGEPLLPVADDALAQMRLAQILPEFLEDARAAIVRVRHRDELDHEARTDHLTGMLNRRAIDHVFAAMKPEDAVVIIDLDHFKAVNDQWGHATGDEVLISFARALRDRSRADDHFARVGGDELLAVIADATEDAIAAFLGRLHETWLASRPRDVTYSAGVAWMGTRTVAETLAAADKALYSAKRDGRDRVVIAS